MDSGRDQDRGEPPCNCTIQTKKALLGPPNWAESVAILGASSSTGRCNDKMWGAGTIYLSSA